jgi:glycosyltransferase involved in cell wall biosynthesis
LAGSSSTPSVLQVVLSLNPGGTERLVVELIRRLRAELPMAACCLDAAGSWGAGLRDEQIDVEALDRQPGFHPSLGRRIARIVDRQKIDVIHCHHYSPFVYSCVAALFRPSVRIVFTEHGRLSDAGPSAKRRLANRVLSRVPHQVFTVSGDLREHIVAEGFPAEQVAVIYNGIDIGPRPSPADRVRVRHELGVSGDTVVVGTLARLDPVKDLAVLVRAVAALNRVTPARLVVVGDGDERRTLEQAARDADGGASTLFLGQRDDARTILAGCDVYANSSISEGVSLTILEAMAAVLPVVATRVGGTPEVVDETCAVLVPSRDADAMTAALVELARQPDRRARLGQAGRERVERRFTLDRMVREYRDAYVRAAA